jgi:hypothetical protein
MIFALLLLSLLGASLAYVDLVSDKHSLCQADCAQTVVPKCFEPCLVNRLLDECYACSAESPECLACFGLKRPASLRH